MFWRTTLSNLFFYIGTFEDLQNISVVSHFQIILPRLMFKQNSEFL